MDESERQAWTLLIRSNIAPSKWTYHGRVVGPDATEHSFIHKETRQEIFLVERKEEHERKNNRSYLWYSPRTDSEPPHHDKGERAGLSGRGGEQHHDHGGVAGGVAGGK
mgnify:CR=1 FL=1